MNNETTNHLLWREPSEEAETAVHCLHCGDFFDEDGNVIEAKNVGNYNLVREFCDNECKELHKKESQVKVLVEFTFDEKWEAYIPDNIEKIKSVLDKNQTDYNFKII